ncbi:hypothetical protein CYMTET_15429 [Cymbomonas tetramitiformis]|uniref:Uncharacterized protein n=1 Tax=Cymbomonas tetramitiformis TaxID=36881 RepID=A0AAE0L9A8_9CHLO|nr:hypothetical protein CYMTET_15429 [Cymbomonas tetramitiformis]
MPSGCPPSTATAPGYRSLHSPMDDVRKSPEDARDYRRLCLESGLLVLLISDPDMRASCSVENEFLSNTPDGRGAKRAAAAMAVEVGSFADPDTAPGLSHLLEHMLFMGSEKYSGENEYGKFLVEHGGDANAFTEAEHTCFHFQVDPGSLRGALDRFAQHFVAPLILEESLDREVLAVDSEFQQALQSDHARLFQVQCHTARRCHPFCKFSWGNRASLVDTPAAAGLRVRGMLQDHFARHYRADRMALVVLGAEPLDALEHWTRESFAGLSEDGPRCSRQPAVPTCMPGGVSSGADEEEEGRRAEHLGDMMGELSCKAVGSSGAMSEIPSCKGGDTCDATEGAAPHEAAPPYDTVDTVLYQSLAVQADHHQLHITFPLPCLRAHYQSKPAEYLSHLIGHEGCGSLLSALKAQKLATDLSAGVGGTGFDRASTYELFTVTVTLTQHGLPRALDVAGLLFVYLAMLRRAGPLEWVFRELSSQNEVQFRFQPQASAQSTPRYSDLWLPANVSAARSDLL